MRKLLIIGLCLASAGMLHAQTGLDKTATQIASEMMPGWNLGNTMEAAVTWGSNPAAVFNNNGGLASETVVLKLSEYHVHGCSDISVTPPTIPLTPLGWHVSNRL